MKLFIGITNVEEAEIAIGLIEKYIVGVTQDKKVGIPIEDFCSTMRVYNTLKRLGITTAEEVTLYSAKEMLAIGNFGMKSLRALEESLAEHGLYLKGRNPVDRLRFL